ncbi:MAG: methyltransferase, partial [Betaproteobacteria bacterium]
MTSNVELKPFGAVSDSMGLSPSQAHANGAHSGKTSWREHFRNRLNRWMVSPALYQWSVSNVLTRWFTQKRTREVFDLMAGFVHFQVLLNCLRLGVLARVQQSPCTLNDLALYTGLPEERLDRLVWSAVSLKLMDQRSAGRYGIGPLGVLVVSYPGIEAMVEHNALLYADMGDTPKMLRSQAGVHHALMHQYWPYTVGEDRDDGAFAGQPTLEHRNDGSSESQQTERYSQLMSVSQNFVIQEIIGAYDFSQHRCVLDIGCGLGRFASTVAQHVDTLDLQLMDLPEVVKLTKSAHQHTPYCSRLSFIPGSFKTDPLPMGSDLVTLVRVAHDHNDADVLHLFQKVHAALPTKGSLLLAEPMADPQGERQDAYFHFYLMAMGEGRLRTPQKLSNMMLQAGFSRVELLSNPMPTHARILVAHKT